MRRSDSTGSEHASRPGVPMIRRHSRSSSQLATLGSLSLTSMSPRAQSQQPPVARNGTSAGSSRNVSPLVTPGSSPRMSRKSLDASPRRPANEGPGSSGLLISTEPANMHELGEATSSEDDDDEWSTGLMMATGKRKAPTSSGTASPLPSLTTEEATMLPPTDPTSAATISFPDTSANLAQFIQQKRRQASAPYFASARSHSLFSPGAGFGISTISSTTSGEGRTGYTGAWNSEAPPVAEPARSRSRASSRRGTVGGLKLDSGFASDFTHEPGMVMTPTTEEWRQLAGDLAALAEARAREEPRSRNGARTPPVTGKLGSTASSSSSSSIDLTSPMIHSLPTSRPRTPPRSTIPAMSPPTPPIPAIKSSFSYQTNRTGFDSPNAVSLSCAVEPGSSAPNTAPLPSAPTFVPAHRPQLSESAIRPTLARGSLSTPTGSLHTAPSPEIEKPPPSPRPPSPVELDRVTSLGPIDPRAYSAVSGRRSIDSFIIEGEAGKGAYGSVVKAREKGPDGRPVGPPVIIKYIIKQRILADCWKKHKILGPIPIEVHVLDHLRRVPYKAKPPLRRRTGGGYIRPVALVQRRDSAPSLKEGTLTGHPNICGMLDFFEDGEYYYLVMPHAGADPDCPSTPKGQDLFDYVDEHPDGLTAPMIHRILSQIADAVYFLHEHGIVHRDIKDENVVLDHDGNVQLIDFGSAAYIKDGKKFDTFSGTLDFAAPEVLRGARYGGREQDVWAFGVLGYVLICGECPFWSPEEAMTGLTPGSRAYASLTSKMSTTSSCSPASSTSTKINEPTVVVASSDGGGGGGGGGGGAHTMDDAVDLVMRCLEVKPQDRPTADMVCEHRFMTGLDGGGWRGHRGWEVDAEQPGEEDAERGDDQGA